MWNFLFNPNGRISRSDMWLKYLLPYLGLYIITVVIQMVGMQAATSSGNSQLILLSSLPGLLLGLFYLWPGIAVQVKRYHDRGMSGWWVLWTTLIAIAFGALTGFGFATAQQSGQAFSIFGILGGIGLLAVVVTIFVLLYCLPGQKGDNKFGPDPLANKR